MNCRKPYDENTSNNTCERSYFDILTIPVLILLILMGISTPLIIISRILASTKKKNKHKIIDEIYAFMTVIQFIARIFLMANLWASTSVFTFALTFMNIA